LVVVFKRAKVVFLSLNSNAIRHEYFKKTALFLRQISLGFCWKNDDFYVK